MPINGIAASSVDVAQNFYISVHQRIENTENLRERFGNTTKDGRRILHFELKLQQ